MVSLRRKEGEPWAMQRLVEKRRAEKKVLYMN